MVPFCFSPSLTCQTSIRCTSTRWSGLSISSSTLSLTGKKLNSILSGNVNESKIIIKVFDALLNIRMKRLHMWAPGPLWINQFCSPSICRFSDVQKEKNYMRTLGLWQQSLGRFVALSLLSNPWQAYCFGFPFPFQCKVKEPGAPSS